VADHIRPISNVIYPRKRLDLVPINDPAWVTLFQTGYMERPYLQARGKRYPDRKILGDSECQKALCTLPKELQELHQILNVMEMLIKNL